MKLSLTGKIILTILCFGIALVGFMMKLPAVFRHHDTELHTLFYFLAAGFLNILFVKRSLGGHVLVFVLLYVMGIGIEYAQEYSNSLVSQRIHGRYDAEDVDANLKGLIYFSVLWVVYVIIWYATRSLRSKTTRTEEQVLGADPDLVSVVAHSNQKQRSLHRAIDPQDEQKLEMAIQLLTEVMNRYPGDRLGMELQETITDLKNKIDARKREVGNEISQKFLQ